MIMAGHWTFTGYNIENDSAYELLLVAHLQIHGTQALPHNAPISTANTALAGYLSTGYPLGSQSLLAVVSGLLGVSAAVVWQGFISTMAAIGALACSTLSGRTMDRRLAALTGLFSPCPLRSLANMRCRARSRRWAWSPQRSARSRSAGMRRSPCAPQSGWPWQRSPLAAILAIYSAAGVPYIGAVAGVSVLAIPFVHRIKVRQLALALRPVAIGVATLLVLSLPSSTHIWHLLERRQYGLYRLECHRPIARTTGATIAAQRAQRRVAIRRLSLSGTYRRRGSAHNRRHGSDIRPDCPSRAAAPSPRVSLDR